MQQIKSLHKTLYQIGRIDETEYSAEVYERLEKLRLYKKLTEEGCSQETALEALKISRATFYRWKNLYNNEGLTGLERQSKRPIKIRRNTWCADDEQLVLKIRKQYPMWGKNKIATILQREHNKTLSTSTIGRIITRFIKAEK
jgi:transposase